MALKCQKCGTRPKQQPKGLNTDMLEGQGWTWQLILNGTRSPMHWELRCPACKPPPPPPKAA